MAMKTMYPAMNGSPSTELAVALTVSATTIVLLDASKLPPAPNLAVIGSDINAEIVQYAAVTDNVLSGCVRGVSGTTAQSWPSGTVVGRNVTSYDHDTFMENITELDNELANQREVTTEMNSRLVKVESSIEDLEAQMVFKRYGVSGIGQSANALTRLYDSVGMTAEVGTDDSSVTVTNDFDNAGPFKWRKCVGTWSLDEVTGRAKFNVNAYLGDPNFAEDGSMGNFVAVEIPTVFRYRSGGTKVVSLHQYPGYEPYEIFRRDNDPNDLIDKLYFPCYALAEDANGMAVSLPGLDNAQGSYYSLTQLCRTYNDGELGNMPILPRAAWFSFVEDMFQIEFADQNCQAIMQGCCNLRSENADLGTWRDETHLLLNNYNAGRVVGEYVAVILSNEDRNIASRLATHRIISITRCDASGNASASGTYSLLELENLGKNYYNYDYSGGTQYRCAARPWRTGACNNVVTPSGSPTNNNSGYYPMRYRYVENIYGNQYKTASDLFNQRLGSGDSNYYLSWYLLLKPEEYVPVGAGNPSADELASDLFAKLNIVTEHENYVDGYIVSKQYDNLYDDIWCPLLTVGGSATTYYCDRAYLVLSNVVRACRFGGSVIIGASAGLSALAASLAPSASSAYSGGALCPCQ